MLPKQKEFIEWCFENGVIDSVVGTDALAMGVNFPIERTVFAQLSKNGKSISRNLFEQLAGRAGRKGYFDRGQVFFSNIIDDILEKNWGYYEQRDENDKYKELKQLYFELLFKENESLHIRLKPNIRGILKGDTNIEDEVKFISQYSTDNLDEVEIKNEIEEILSIVLNYNTHQHSIYREHDDQLDYDDRYEAYRLKEELWTNEEKEQDEKDIQIAEEYEDMAIQHLFRRGIVSVYSEYFTPLQNCQVFADILLGRSLEDICRDNNLKGYRGLTTLKKYIKVMPAEFRSLFDLTTLDKLICKCDSTELDNDRGKISISEIKQDVVAQQTTQERIDTLQILNTVKYDREEYRAMIIKREIEMEKKELAGESKKELVDLQGKDLTDLVDMSERGESGGKENDEK